MINFKAFRESEFLRREINLRQAKKQELVVSRKVNNKKLHIVYVMTHVGICGGTKIILEHANHLIKYNQLVTIVSHFEKPTWFPIDDGINYIRVPLKQELATGIPDCDVIVATYWREINECIARRIAPVVYFEQGDYHLFAWEDVCQREKNYIYKQLQIVPFIYTVSKGASKKIKTIFGRDSTVINNAIDNSVFYYDSAHKKNNEKSFTLMFIGSEESEFKRIGDIHKALYLLQKTDYRIKPVWVTPDKPIHAMGTVYVNPKQIQIGNLFRKSDIFVSASLYESFSLPALESMASGCAVITTKNEGVVEYAADGRNCIMTAMRDPQDITRKIIQVIENKSLRKIIISEGLKTAARYSWNSIIPQIIEYYRHISGFTPIEREIAYNVL